MCVVKTTFLWQALVITGRLGINYMLATRLCRLVDGSDLYMYITLIVSVREDDMRFFISRFIFLCDSRH